MTTKTPNKICISYFFGVVAGVAFVVAAEVVVDGSGSYILA